MLKIIPFTPLYAAVIAGRDLVLENNKLPMGSAGPVSPSGRPSFRPNLFSYKDA